MQMKVDNFGQTYGTTKHSTIKRIAAQLNDLINDEIEIPSWMTSGRTVLCQKDPKNGNAVDNYRPISCLPLMWKLLTGIISANFYTFLGENEMLPEEQKGCRRNSRGTKDQLLVDKTILADCKRRHKNLAMAWVDYKNAYDMVPHSLVIECLRFFRVLDNVVNFIERSMTNWKVQLTSCGEIFSRACKYSQRNISRRQPITTVVRHLHDSPYRSPQKSQNGIYIGLC